MCRIHIENLQGKDIAFERDGAVSALLPAPSGSPFRADCTRLLETYILHVQMSIKYFLRRDFFMLEGVLRILLDSPAALLLSAYDTTTWGGVPSRLHALDGELQRRLMLYGCVPDLSFLRENLLREVDWFIEDAETVCGGLSAALKSLFQRVVADFRQKTKPIF